MRVKTGPSRHYKHKATFALAKGYRMSRRHLVKSASQAVLHAGEYAFMGRKRRKQDIRKLWILRLSGALSQMDYSYSRFINGLKKSNIQLDRKILSDICYSDLPTFKKIVEKVQSL